MNGGGRGRCVVILTDLQVPAGLASPYRRCMNSILRRPTCLGVMLASLTLLTSVTYSAAADATAAGVHTPFGHLDSVMVSKTHQVHLHGWAIDPDNRFQPLQIAVYHGVHGIGWFKSATFRPDVARVFHAGTHQGFDITVTQTPGKHHMCAYAINIGPGANVLIGCLTVTVP